MTTSFIDYLKSASGKVRRWPLWKQQAAGLLHPPVICERADDCKGKGVKCRHAQVHPADAECEHPLTSRKSPCHFYWGVCKLAAPNIVLVQDERPLP